MDKASRSGGKGSRRQSPPGGGRLPRAPRPVRGRADGPALVEPKPEADLRREERARELDARLAATVRKGVAALLDRKAEKVVVLSLRDVTTMADFFVVAGATNERQAQALADAVEAALKKDGLRPISIEGYLSSTWILIDYGDVVFHVFREEARRFYGLEKLWADAGDETESFLPPPLPATPAG